MSQRIRTVKPELFRHEELFEAECHSQLPLRLAFIGLFSCCDRAGRFRWKPRSLKVAIFPYDTINFEAVLIALWEAGLIQRYEHQGQCYGCIPSWFKHQRINQKEPQSVLPPPQPEGSSLPSNAVFKQVAKPRIFNEPPTETRLEDATEPLSVESEPALLTPTEMTPVVRLPSEARAGTCQAQPGTCLGGYGREVEVEREREVEQEEEMEEEGKGKGSLVAQNVRPQSVAEPFTQIFEYWKRVMNHPHSKLDPKRKKLIHQALSLGYSADELCLAIWGCSLTPHNQGHNDRGQRYDGLHIILRDSDQIDRFMHNAKHPPRVLNEADRRLQGNVASMERWLDEKRKEAFGARH